MSTAKYEKISDLKVGGYDYKILVRVIKFWRGVTRTGQEFSSFNVILIDNKKSRIHAFVPTICAESLLRKCRVVTVRTIKNFTVEFYKPTEKFRCLCNDKKLSFSKDTEIKELADEGYQIPHELFDFHDHSELDALSKQNMYLADIIEIIIKHKDLLDFNNRHGTPQRQAKFTISDGRSAVKVTLWDAFGERFEQAMAGNLEKPVIIIFSSCRVGIWEDQVDIGHVPATQIYLNHQHHAVFQLRKLMQQPSFEIQEMEDPKNKKPELLNIKALKELGKENIQRKVYVHVNFTRIQDGPNWYYNACTNCDKETTILSGNLICTGCGRVIPHPDKKFQVVAEAADNTGAIHILLQDREIRTLIGKRVGHIIDQLGDEKSFPLILAKLASGNYTVMLVVAETNVLHQSPQYLATNICIGFVTTPEGDSDEIKGKDVGTSQATTSTYTAVGLSDVTIGTQ